MCFVTPAASERQKVNELTARVPFAAPLGIRHIVKTRARATCRRRGDDNRERGYLARRTRKQIIPPAMDNQFTFCSPRSPRKQSRHRLSASIIATRGEETIADKLLPRMGRCPISAALRPFFPPSSTPRLPTTSFPS